MGSQDIYKKLIIDHYKNPRNWGRLKQYSHHAKESNLSCGDEIEVFLNVNNNGTISDASFKGSGCALSLAGGSLLMTMIVGKKVEEVIAYDDKRIVESMGLEFRNARKKCAVLAMHAMQKALDTNNTRVE